MKASLILGNYTAKRNGKDEMKRLMLNGEYLTKSDVRRKDKELQKKNTLKRGQQQRKSELQRSRERRDRK